jgi:small subunit ribosomal protein S16
MNAGYCYPDGTGYASLKPVPTISILDKKLFIYKLCPNMSVRIRLKRTGRHKDPHYRVVVMDSRKKRDGRVIEYVGHYHPKLEGENSTIDLEKVESWIKKGAQMSDTVRSLVSKSKRSAD